DYYCHVWDRNNKYGLF
nr:immunoglobulin light chain junction region [Macaca mulatta]